MSARKKLIFFMEMEAKRIEEKLNLPSTTYFTKDDSREIHSWNPEVASSIWGRIEEVGQGNPIGEFLTNVFCLYYKLDCDKCSYGKRHGKCMEEGSDYKKIIEKSNKQQDNKLIKIVLPQFWYREVINLINKLVQ